MHILDTIVAQKKKEVEKSKQLRSVSDLEKAPFFHRPVASLKAALTAPAATGIIAEFKRRSPSKGVINSEANVADVTGAYARLGAAGISVLTDQEFFGGSLEDLMVAANLHHPLLRKDFMIDAYQVVEAKAFGASVILLIAACLTPVQVKELALLAKNTGLEVLLEIHDATELGHICAEVDFVGVNNRNLKTFAVSIETSRELIAQIPASMPAIAESGISDIETIVSLKQSGYRGFLIGEQFMKYADPAIAFADFMKQLKARYEN